MFREINTSDLTEGDWIAKSIAVKGRYICGPKDLGVSEKQIQLLKKLKVRKVIIKRGIPFVPVFLVAGLITLIFGNVVFYLLL